MTVRKWSSILIVDKTEEAESAKAEDVIEEIADADSRRVKRGGHLY
jgi:hypothetical protein